ncbi:hypothetical protein KDRO_C03550 [Kluyveromyces lactis]|nr:hypothetical protein KDRO_C03550 [Kluyveromyces lactis]
MTKDSEGTWVVGYGSLIYKPPPHWKYKVNGIVYGFKRRFWQSSIDHGVHQIHQVGLRL